MSCFSCIFFTYFFFFSSRRRHTRCLSDWSSDVCSSDLLSAQVHTPHASRFIGVGEASFQKLSPIPQQLFPVLAVNEIGRASCRERAEVSVVAGSLKKKNETHVR